MSAAIEWLGEKNESLKRQAEDEARRKKEADEEEERKKHEGTKVSSRERRIFIQWQRGRRVGGEEETRGDKSK